MLSAVKDCLSYDISVYTCKIQHFIVEITEQLHYLCCIYMKVHLSSYTFIKVLISNIVL